MESVSNNVEKERWAPIYKMSENLSLLSEYTDNDVDPNFLHEVKVLVLGAGGLGCEILKDLALSGFKDIHVIDLDTIEVSNLNRQFLFTEKDVGKPKAEVAAAFINNRVEGCKVTPYMGDLKAKPSEFYEQFSIIISGLDSLECRRWVNCILIELAKTKGLYIPFIDGGSERFEGHIRVINPLDGPCLDCTMWMYPPERGYPMCTIASNPRRPEHCIEWAMIEYSKQHDGKKADGDNHEDVVWCNQVAQKRAADFNIEGVDEKTTLGVMKNVIPAIASTNSVIAAMCVNEALKLVLSGPSLKNYCLFQGQVEIYTTTQDLFKNDSCLVCSTKEYDFYSFGQNTLEEFIESLKSDEQLQLGNPSLLYNSGVPLYFKSIEHTHENLKKKINELISDGDIIKIIDPVHGDNRYDIKVHFNDS